MSDYMNMIHVNLSWLRLLNEKAHHGTSTLCPFGTAAAAAAENKS
jgi:hypothetical protein